MFIYLELIYIYTIWKKMINSFRRTRRSDNILKLLLIISVCWFLYLSLSLQSFLSPNETQLTDRHSQRYELSSDDGEVAKLKRYLMALQKTGKPKAVIYYLALGNRIKMLIESLASVDEYFNMIYRYPVIVFYEDTDVVFDERMIRNRTSSPVFFQQVHFEIPSFINKSQVPVTHVNGLCTWKFTLGYRHMCRFQAVGVYQQPIMDDVEYALRLDDDSLFIDEINYDIFAFMRQMRLQYGFIAEAIDDPLCVRGLWEATDVYIRNRSLTPYFYNEWPRHRIVLNNFELMASALWKSESYRKFVDYIDRLGGIYFYRWGDAAIKTIAVSLFIPRNETFLFRDLDYIHGEGL